MMNIIMMNILMMSILKIKRIFPLSWVILSLVIVDVTLSQTSSHAENYVRFPETVIPIVQGGQYQGAYELRLVVEAKTADMAGEIQENLAYYQDTVITFLYSLLAVVWDKDDPPSVDDIKDSLSWKLQEIFPHIVLKNIFIKDIHLYLAKD